jgi:EAL domain-containing protein (putative c-di-GMP-specific phosphodiesterase class I)
MYVAKEAGSGYAVYQSEHDRHSPASLALLGELGYAIDNDELVLHYQPKIDLKTGQLTGVEALVRWQHPRVGLIQPDRFVPQAEQTALIQPLGRWVLNAALSQCRAWQIGGVPIPVSVNLSMRDLHDPHLPEAVAAVLERWEVLPGQLMVEITETGIMANPDRAVDVLTRLHNLGVGTAIDDFGAGYSSFRYLKQLPVDELKIDKSFVQNMALDPSDAAIVHASIELGRRLGLTVVAEGVEDEATWRLLASLGCDMAQGYYAARPLPAADFITWLAEYRPRPAGRSGRGSQPAIGAAAP